ncbi:hypothetical protein [Blastopirellula marina]|uniref:Uncharacterized protein n=1 Tax=Blastopirellula marina DSM 3645 TaxID=314230 RepID=A3ZML4_9BACT|nr:hypothetical protein [Blastopirellula marina]EAQ82187.1 hypothetical protein DSM3645_00695 [Blastopirellula marina DSM 3645]
MFIRSFALVVACLLFCTGCPSGPSRQGAGTTDPEIAQTVHDQVTNFVTAAEKSPRSAKGGLDLMLESLEGASERGEGFTKVRDEAKKLQSLYEAKADSAALKSQMESLQAAADALTNEAS